MGLTHDVYTDGACKGNHLRSKQNTIAGVGVWFADNDPRNISEKLQGVDQTNNRAELTAIIRAIEIFFNDYKDTHPADHPTLVCHTDSEYCKNGIEKWTTGWIKNGWKNAKKQPVKNQDLWKQLLELQKIYSVKYIWVKGHAGDHGNEMANDLAEAGCFK